MKNHYIVYRKEWNFIQFHQDMEFLFGVPSGPRIVKHSFYHPIPIFKRKAGGEIERSHRICYLLRMRLQLYGIPAIWRVLMGPLGHTTWHWNLRFIATGLGNSFCDLVLGLCALVMAVFGNRFFAHSSIAINTSLPFFATILASIAILRAQMANDYP